MRAPELVSPFLHVKGKFLVDFKLERTKHSTVPRLKNAIDFITMNALIWQFLALGIAFKHPGIATYSNLESRLITAANKGDYGAYFQQITSFLRMISVLYKLMNSCRILAPGFQQISHIGCHCKIASST